MLEKIPEPKPEMSLEELLRIANLIVGSVREKLLLRNESFSFEGIEESAYRKLKSESDEFPEYATDIDELIRRFNSEGFKIVITGGVNVYAMPTNCDSTSIKDIEGNTVFLKYFKTTGNMDDDLKVLINALRILSKN